MAFANPSYTDVLASGIESRSGQFRDNVTKSNAALMRFKQKGNIRLVSGGTKILEEISFAENGTAMWYTGGDQLNVAAQDVLSAAEFPWAQAAAAVTLTGLEDLQNSGKERVIDMMEGRLRVAEASLKNLVCQGVYSDGTGFGGKQLIGLAAAVPTAPTVGTYGGINRATFPVWRSQLVAPGAGVITAANINTYMNQAYAATSRGSDVIDLVLADNAMWSLYMAFLQNLTRFVDVKVGDLGFPSVKYMSADVVLDGGIGGFAPVNTMLFLNTSFMYFRPHKRRNFTAINPGRRYSTNQDAETQLIGFAGQMTSGGPQFSCRLHNN
jgi:hypothetical protein